MVFWHSFGIVFNAKTVFQNIKYLLFDELQTIDFSGKLSKI